MCRGGKLGTVGIRHRDHERRPHWGRGSTGPVRHSQATYAVRNYHRRGSEPGNRLLQRSHPFIADRIIPIVLEHPPPELMALLPQRLPMEWPRISDSRHDQCGKIRPGRAGMWNHFTLARQWSIRSLAQASHVLQYIMDLRARQLRFPRRHVGLSLMNGPKQVLIGFLRRRGGREVGRIGAQ